MLAVLYTLYILALGRFRPHMVPPVPQAERDAVSRAELWVKLLRVAAPPLGLVAAVLGSIIAGIAAPTEAASMGALGAIVVTLIGGRFSFRMLRDTAHTTVIITAQMMFILICAQVFAISFRGLGGEDLVKEMFAFLPGGVNADVWFMLFIIFLLGFFVEWIEICYIAVPLFMPVLLDGGANMVWVAALICVMLQTSFLTPPFGWALFYLRSVAPAAVRTIDMYRGVIPFVSCRSSRSRSCSCFPSSRSACRARSGGSGRSLEPSRDPRDATAGVPRKSRVLGRRWSRRSPVSRSAGREADALRLVPTPGGRHDAVEVVARRPAEFAPCATVVRDQHRRVSGAPRMLGHLESATGHAGDRIDEAAHGRAPARPEIDRDRIVLRDGASQRQDMGLGEVQHVDVVAHGGPVGVS